MKNRPITTTIIAFLLLLIPLFFGCSSEIQKGGDAEVPDHYLYLDVKSDANFIFSTYDVGIYLDDAIIGTVSNGGTFQELIKVKEGSHQLSVKKVGDASISAVNEIDIGENSTISCQIKHKKNKIEIKDLKIVGEIPESLLAENDSATSEEDNTEVPDHYLYLDVTSNPNLIFNIYDMEVYIDDTLLGTVANGKAYQELIKVKEGLHQLSVKKVGDTGIFATSELSINEDSTFSCCIKHNENKIEIKDTKIVGEVPADLLRYETYKNPGDEEETELADGSYHEIQEVSINGDKKTIRLRDDGGTNFVLTAISGNSEFPRLSAEDLIIECSACDFEIRKVPSQLENESTFDVTVISQIKGSGEYEMNIYSAYDRDTGMNRVLATLPVTIYHVEPRNNQVTYQKPSQRTTNEPANPDADITVYITPFGEKYHYSSTCPASNNVSAVSLESAKKSGRGPCSKCAQ